MKPLLDVEKLTLAFGSHRAVHDLSFTVARGEAVALVGESGSGKSATALAVLRLIERDGGRIEAGRIRLYGESGEVDLTAADPRTLGSIRGRRIGMVFQEPMTALNPVMRVGEQVAEVLRHHDRLDRKAAGRRVLELFERVRIPDPARRVACYPHELSGGMRQRVMIAMALACRPDLLIADEPTTALDVTTQAEILGLIRELRRAFGMSLLFITHDMGVVAEIADRVVVLQRGERVEDVPVATLFHRPRHPYTRQLMAAAPRLGSGAPRPPARSEPVLEVRDLAVRFPVAAGPFARRREFHAVAGVSFTLARGETLGLVGESGCGKSTLARAILRLIEPSEGEVRIDGRRMTGLSAAELRHVRARAQMVFQDPQASLNPRLPVHELVTEPARRLGRVDRRAARDLAVELLAAVGLEPDAADRYPHQFSGGQRQRLCIARALSVRPALIVADEPVSALDVSIARQITDLMAELQAREGVAFLFISHDLAVVERVSHRIAVMRAGRIVELGPTAEVLARPAHPYTRRLLAAVPMPDPDRRRERTGDLAPEPEPPAQLWPFGARPRHPPLVEISPGHFAEAIESPEGELAARPRSAAEPGRSPPAWMAAAARRVAFLG